MLALSEATKSLEVENTLSTLTLGSISPTEQSRMDTYIWFSTSKQLADILPNLKGLHAQPWAA
jgi:hypothetical protein